MGSILDEVGGVSVDVTRLTIEPTVKNTPRRHTSVC